VVLFDPADRTKEVTTFSMLRQQAVRGAAQGDDGAMLCLADWVEPLGSEGPKDVVGGFAVTAGLGLEKIVGDYEAKHDDYHAIIAKALADRLAEAFAEAMHEQARRDLGYGSDVSSEDLIAEKYRGIRPAFGYPACPDHTEKGKLFDLLGAREAGLELTEHYAMTPAASVSGIYLSHPAARYFLLGRIGRDQVDEYASRKGISGAEVERWLGPNLGYDPASER
jgi:5-methyltetrahydrofolate--homocysteine methyltransferase